MMKAWNYLLVLLGCVSAMAEQPITPAAPVDQASDPKREAEGKHTDPEPGTGAKMEDRGESAPVVGSEEKAVELPKGGEEAVRLQIFLDQKNFGPGFIDGKPGQFTKLAIENYNTGLGREKDDVRVVEESVKAVTQTYATAIIPSSVDQYVDATLPTKKALQATRKSMPYRSVAEFMAERYHTSVDLLVELNGASVVRNAKARSVLKVPNINPFKIEDLKVGRSHKADEHLSARHIVVDTHTRQVYVYQLVLPKEPEQTGGEVTRVAPVKLTVAKPVLVASFPITPGQVRFIPKGFWNLKNSVELPEWRYDKKLLETGVRGKEYLSIPPGPNNPVGVIWNGLTKSGIGIHGTDNPRTIGRAQSAGCIRLANWDAARIPTLVRPGAVVVVK
ncbi:MAG: L,D-transpeptidase [Akkermansiaceae bacterium]|nr:L,D-transpeptidase [Akkermansiaceae bacterium]